MRRKFVFKHPLNSNLSRLVIPKLLKSSRSFSKNFKLKTGIEQEGYMDAFNFEALCGGRNLLVRTK